MKILRRIMSVGVCILTVLGTLSVASASSFPINPYGDPGLNGKNYVVTTQAVGETDITWRHLAKNYDSDETDTVTKTVSRTMSFTGSISGSGEVNALLAKLDVTAEVSFGATKTETSSRTYLIPGRSAYICLFGSLLCKTTGRMETWVNGTRTSSKNVNAQFSYMEYSDKIPA